MKKLRRRIGIMGGTFDPVHTGHLRMGEAAVKALALSEVWYIPSGTPAYKLKKQEVSDKEERYSMLELALAGREGFRLSDIELRRPGNSYTSDTLRFLTEKYPDTHFYFLVGGDSLDYMDSWHEPESIFRLATVAVFPRTDFSTRLLREKAAFLRKEYGAHIRFLKMEPFDSSSTEIRKRIAAGKDVTGLLPEEVCSYIRAHHLYREEADDDE